MADIGHQETDELLEEMEKRIQREYQQAVRELEEKLRDYMRRFEKKDEIWRRRLDAGEVTRREYQEWRKGQMIVGKRWEDMKETLAEDLHNSNVIARGIIDGYMPDVYAVNHNYGTYQIETSGNVNTSYTLYDHETVERIIRYNPEILPPPGPRMNSILATRKDLRWQEGQIQSVTLQGILQGESIPNLAKRIANTLGEFNHKDTIRYARTATTGAENAGRMDSYRRAQNMGIDLEREWLAVHDERTRHTHSMLDGQKRKIDEPFEVDGYEIMYPGDPKAAGEMIWNCRCTLGGAVKGWKSYSGLSRYTDPINGQSYEEWKQGHSKSQPIEKQEKQGEAIRQKTIDELYRDKN